MDRVRPINPEADPKPTCHRPVICLGSGCWARAAWISASKSGFSCITGKEVCILPLYHNNVSLRWGDAFFRLISILHLLTLLSWNNQNDPNANIWVYSSQNPSIHKTSLVMKAGGILGAVVSQRSFLIIGSHSYLVDVFYRIPPLMNSH